MPGRAPLVALFDHARRIPGLGITLFERTTPGAVATFRTWAAANGVAVEERDLQRPPGALVVSTTPGSSLDICIHTTKVQP